MTIAEAGGVTPPRTGRAGLMGWAMFDWAAQPFFTVVTTFIFGPYFVSRVAENPADGQAMWGYAAAAAGFVIAIMSPVMGSIADATGPRKPWIAFFAAIKILCLCGLWIAVPDDASIILPTLILFSMASVAAEFSIVFNDSMMPRLVSKENMGWLSNLAWGLGYLGGMIVLIFIVGFLAASPDTGKTILGADPLLGLDPANGEGDRASGPLAAVWYLIFILPMMLFTPDTKRSMKLGPAVSHGLRELRDTLGEVRRRAGIFRFLLARMIYQDGVNGLLLLGGTFAAAMFSWQTIEIGIYGIILNVVAIFGCLVAGWIDTRVGSKAVCLLALVLLVAATVGIVSTGPGFTFFTMALSTEDSGGLFGTAAEKAYIAFGLLIGLAFGPVQASSRSYLARSVSEDEAGRYFGIYALTGRATSFLAPLSVAVLTDVTDSARIGMGALIVFLVGGMLLLLATPYPAGEPAEK